MTWSRAADRVKLGFRACARNFDFRRVPLVPEVVSRRLLRTPSRSKTLAIVPVLLSLACCNDLPAHTESGTEASSDTRMPLSTSSESEGDATEESDSETTTATDATETSGSTDDTTEGNDCAPGEQGCVCLTGECVEGLVCLDDVCQSCPPGERACSGLCMDLAISDSNCGSCGSSCTVLFHAGHCDSGECQPTWSDCLDALSPQSCAEICSDIGQACFEGGCLGNTVIVSPTLGNCEAGFMTAMSPGSCEQALDPVEGFYRCCCTQ